MSQFSAIFRLRAVDDGMSSTIDAAKAKVGGIGNSLGNAFKGSVGKIFSATAAMTMLKGTMEEVLNRAKQYNNLGQRMGIPAVEVQKLDKAAERAGINVASLGKSMLLMQKFAAEGIVGATDKAKTLTSALKLSRQELELMKQGGTEGLALLADKMKQITDEGARDALGLKILGEKWFEVKQLIEQGGDAIKNAGADQTTWGKETQDSLSRTQRAWANMWNDLSVMVADFMRDAEPLIGFLRLLINFFMPMIRLALVGIGYVLDTISYSVLSIAYYWGKVTGESDGYMKKLEEGMNNIEKRQKERSEKLRENIIKDVDALHKGAQMMAGISTGEEVKDKTSGSSNPNDKRTADDIQALEEYNKKKAEIDNKMDLANAKEEEKSRILLEQLSILRQQEKILKERFGQTYKETKDYKELKDQEIALQRKIRKQIRDDNVREAAREADLVENEGKRRLELMKAQGADSGEIFKEEFDLKKQEIIRLGEEYDAMTKDEFSSNEDRMKQFEKIKSALGEADVMAAKKNAVDLGVAPVTSGLQNIGGGGAVAVSNIPQMQLEEQRKTTKAIEDLVAIMSTRSRGINFGEGLRNRYGKPSVN